VLLSHWLLRSRIEALERTSADSFVSVGRELDAFEDRMDAAEKRSREAEAETARVRASVAAVSRDTESRIAQGVEGLAQRSELNTALGEVRAQVALLEAYWAKQGTVIEPLSAEALAKGYTLPFDGQGPLGLYPVGDVLAATDPHGLVFVTGCHLRSSGPAAALSKPLSDAGEFSIYLDLKAGNLTQRGPARILSNSRDASLRNVTIGQDEDRYVVRLRTTDTDPSGTTPTLTTSPQAVNGQRQRLLYVRHADQSTLFVDGEEAGNVTVPGDLSVWDHSLPLLVANENRDDRQWVGEVYRIIVFGRPVTVQEADAAAAGGVGGL
jgi:hypothetical protein